ncbi:MFS transporter [Marinobacter sp. SS21]|uniref:MFS transporter n=1 Tax=Marinobacter sp. SS21 TaxID=2979460 RepID=UPI00233155CB|nr:MFS transporter [Marinobacter sp. SS21]MDC0661507.1 MFS transporter [Marinobacter sp. SS21]
MRLLIISLLALFLSLILLITGNSFLTTLLGLRFGLLGVELGTIGLVMVGYSLGFVIGARWGGVVIRRVGHIRAFAVFAAVAAVASLVYPMTDNVWAWWAMRVIGGMTLAALFVTIESWFSAVASNANRATIFSLYQIASYLAAASGQLLIGLSSPISYLPFSLTAMLLVAAIVPLSLSHMHSPELSEPSEQMPLRRMVRLAPLGVVAAFTSGIFIGSFYALAPLFASLTGLDSDQVSLYMFAAVLAAMCFAWPVGWVCDRVQRSYVLLAICVLGGGSSLLNVWLVEATFGIRLAVVCGCMGLSAALYPVAVAITNDQMDSSQMIAASTGLLLSYSFGAVLGPLVSSRLMEVLGPGALFQTLAVSLLLMAVYTLYRQHRRAPLAVAEQEGFVPAIPTLQPIPDIDPRHENFVDTPIEDLFDGKGQGPR